MESYLVNCKLPLLIFHGFAVLPAGNRNNNGNFNNAGNNANFWSSTENNSNNANNWNFNYNNENVNNNWNNKNNAYSVRCLRDSLKFMETAELHHLLLRAYHDARKHKRNTVNQLQFEANLEHNLLDLACDLQSGTYEISRSVCFVNERPVKREIIAANFRDRVVHHLLFNWINPIFERQFIYDSYSCRVGKGTDFAIERAKRFIIRESCNFTRPCWALRLDISGFFMSINRDILFRLIMEGLEKGRYGCGGGLMPIPDRELCLYLIKKFVYNDPLKNAIYRSPKSSWNDLPLNKSLRGTSENCGLPIGNLTSQLFGNIYLNPLDHFVKRKLKIRSYGRYVDDMLLVGSNRTILRSSIELIRVFLMKKLRLRLHPKKVSLQPIERGFPLLGAYVLPWRTYPGRRVVRNFLDCVKNPVSNIIRQKSRIESYKGFMIHYKAQNMMDKILCA